MCYVFLRGAQSAHSTMEKKLNRYEKLLVDVDSSTVTLRMKTNFLCTSFSTRDSCHLKIENRVTFRNADWSTVTTVYFGSCLTFCSSLHIRLVGIQRRNWRGETAWHCTDRHFTQISNRRLISYFVFYD